MGSPFTKELLAAGVSSHRAINIPIRTEIRIEPTTGTLKIDMKHGETRMGERLGLDIKLQVESECDVLDKKTVMDTMNRYDYHPFHYWVFMETETAQKLDGSPTLRYHKYTLVHNPRDPTTKEMKAEIKLSGALKPKEGEIVKHIPNGSEKKTLQEQKLSRSIEELTSVDDAQAANVLMEIALIGGAPKTYEVSLTAAHGFSELTNKWNLHLEMEKDTPRMVCMAGVMERNVQGKVVYNNRLGFGSSCDEHFVMVEGMVASTERQREMSRNTEEARRCDRLSRKIQEKQEQIKTLPQSQWKASLLEELAQMRIERMSMCEEKLRQRTALDRVEMTITPSPNLPTPVYTVAKYLDTILKAVLVEYMAALPAPHSVTDPKVMDITQYRNIRVPGVIRNFLPVTLSKSPIEQLYQGFGGTRLYPKCSIFQGQIKTFDSMTYSYDLDDCYHLVSSEC